MEKQGFNGITSCRKKVTEKSTSKSREHIECPQCNYRQAYRLSDGRRKCKRCGNRFTPRSRKSRLPKATVREIVRLFWLMVPAERVARDLGVNRKTVQRYFSRLRERIAEDAECVLGKMSGEIEVDESYFGGARKGKRGRGAGGKIPVFGLLKRDGEVRVVFPKRVNRASLQGAIKSHVRPQSWVYSDSFRAYNHLDLEGFKHRRISHSESFGKGKVHINGIENFWGFAKRRLKMYHGGFKKNFPLFMREMEYRFNHRNDPVVVNHLVKMLKFGPN